MASRDEILMNFMAATGSDDFGKAFQLLESTDWNFENALGLFHATDDDHPDPNKIMETDFKPAPNPFDLLQNSSTNNKASTSSTNKNKSSSSSSNNTPISGKIFVKIKNKHNGMLFERYYDPKTKVVNVRKEASEYFSIPFDVAVWNCTAIDDDPLSSINKQFLNLEIENLLAEIERSNDPRENRNFSNVVDLSSGNRNNDNNRMVISSDEEEEGGSDDIKFISSSNSGDKSSSRKTAPKRSNCGLLPADAQFSTIPEAINYKMV